MLKKTFLRVISQYELHTFITLTYIYLLIHINTKAEMTYLIFTLYKKNSILILTLKDIKIF